MITNIIEEEKIQKVKNYIKKSNRIAIVSHVSPDGDAVGASLALWHYLSSLEKDRVTVVVPNDFPRYFRWLPGCKEVVIASHYPDFAARIIREADVLFCLDFNEPKRVGILQEAVELSSAHKILVDHHLYPADLFQVSISYPEMSSTCELVFRLLCAMGLASAITKDMATCIYTGMMTDTGSFTYNSNKAEIYTIICELINRGIDKDLIYRKVNQVCSEDRMRMMGYVLYEKMKIFPELGTALITLDNSELLRFHYAPGDVEGLVNLPLNIEGIVFSVFIRETADCIKISLRSVGDFPCNEFASRYFNGGGHKNASGGEYYGQLDDAVAIFEKGLQILNPTLSQEND